ncbi:hypothetical protein OHA72_09305 [Dactylosporangium sp. NBC_01737]|jgi:hypothetical protein|uniref:hypothetical protein n=1 Tax=Dactylosporangium sp. NBC_01737 TaxID=2975959 RepID=UPI002E130D9C|nr:hypothetical protein OHA72_09305 [Dactylosporangium sp. NBC_01737]
MAITTFEAVRAEALFVSHLQCSQAPKSDEIRAAVATTLRRVGIKGCAAQVAGEFGDHPDTAVARMAWALALVRSTYPARRNAPRSVRLLARSA